jgi:hypothetical protein
MRTPTKPKRKAKRNPPSSGPIKADSALLKLLKTALSRVLKGRVRRTTETPY